MTNFHRLKYHALKHFPRDEATYAKRIGFQLIFSFKSKDIFDGKSKDDKVLCNVMCHHQAAVMGKARDLVPYSVAFLFPIPT